MIGLREPWKEILLFGGTTEGRKLSETLAKAGVGHTLCVATEYGEEVLSAHPLVTVRRGRMDREEIRKFVEEGNFAAVVDATHPFAREVTDNIKAALQELRGTGKNVPYLRLRRQGMTEREEDIRYFETHEACAKALEETEGNILLTTGSKELSGYCRSDKVKERLFVRVLPSEESIAACADRGIRGNRIIAMQGPFTAEMNEALMRQYEISCLVTKESGTSGGYEDKLRAARKVGAQVFVIGCPAEEEGYSFSEVCGRLAGLTGKKLQDRSWEIILAGIGMGHPDCVTGEVRRAIRRADILFGAERLLENLRAQAEKHAFYKAEQILPLLRSREIGGTAVILFSGDSGFYSGCRSLYAALQTEIREKRLGASLRVLPGIPSVAYLAACIGESWQDAAVCSTHGTDSCDPARQIRDHAKTFLITSGVKDVNRLGERLLAAHMEDCEIVTGYRLSYPEQRIERHTPAECRELREEGLYTCFVRNPRASGRRLTPGRADGEFFRDRVPMTKEEVREISLCKLRLREDSVVYDIGSGTGSVAVEAAGLSDAIRVYAVERKPEAVALIDRNKEKFGLENLTVVQAEAPEGLAGLPVATHAFIGGSGGRLQEILKTLEQINPNMRVVINAVSMETIGEIREILTQNDRDAEVVQLQVSRAKKAGGHHLMQAENPVWVCTFDLTKDADRIPGAQDDIGEVSV
ncbi:MAG: precorrin-6A reductase [Clostridium sp.]|nr:precorrin-6A reductase [Acetatifactor muris]MCM1563066.1 precorrin-6A reductase [Clostridium sp.]